MFRTIADKLPLVAQTATAYGACKAVALSKTLPTAPDTYASSSDIPSVDLFYKETASLTAFQRNQRINALYARYAHLLQKHIDPSYSSYPNWFAIGHHASSQVGRVLQICETGEALLRNPRITNDGLHTALSQALSASHEEGVLANPYTLDITLHRIWTLCSNPRAGFLGNALGWLHDVGVFVALRMGCLKRISHLEHADAFKKMFKTLEHTLSDGNIAIVLDLGKTIEEYLRFQSHYIHNAEETLALFNLSGTSEKEAVFIYKKVTCYLESHEDIPSDFSGLIKKPSEGRNMLRAACACYAEAACSTSLPRKNRFIALGNNLMAWREQHDIIDPLFNITPKGEMSRVELLRAMTPVMQLPFPEHPWYFDAYARRQKDRDGSVLTPQETEYNWAVFADRWPAIMDSFEHGYKHPDSVWNGLERFDVK